MSDNRSIKYWAEDERPREKMLRKGASALSDAELIGILIASGNKERSAIDLARDVLELSGNNLREMGRLSITELQKVKGIGEAKAITISAAMELGRRRQMSEGIERVTISQSKDAATIVMPLLQDLNHETFCVIYLNHANKILRHEMVSNGGLSATVADIRIILKNSLLYNASRIVVAHNHPSGNTQPSAADLNLTKKLSEAATLMDINLLDHIIVAGDRYVSLADEGLM